MFSPPPQIIGEGPSPLPTPMNLNKKNRMEIIKKNRKEIETTNMSFKRLLIFSFQYLAE